MRSHRLMQQVGGQDGALSTVHSLDQFLIRVLPVIEEPSKKSHAWLEMLALTAHSSLTKMPMAEHIQILPVVSSTVLSEDSLLSLPETPLLALLWIPPH